MKTQNIKRSFAAVFNTFDAPLIVRSPGRVNIIGEHTDYNEGFVLPAAIDKSIYIALSKRTDNQIHLYSLDFDETCVIEISDIRPARNWATYIWGVADQLIQRGHSIAGFNLAFGGDVPVGAGLSSSAAVECATVFGLNELFTLGIGRMEMVHIAQKAEQTFAGVMCGVMDQFASMFGQKDCALKLDCRSLEYELVPLDLKGYKIVLLNTNVKHSLASSEYNTRRQQCEQGVSWVREHYPKIKSLRDISMAMLSQCVAPKDQLIYKRCKFIVEENDRLISGCADLEQGNLQALGTKMYHTHDGLSNAYEVSCAELDFLVDEVRKSTDVLGARMMGGGFGGCTINLIREDAVEKLVNDINKNYYQKMGLDLSVYIAQIGAGTATMIQNDCINV